MGTFGKAFSDSLTMYAKFLVTYIGATIFFLLGATLMIEQSVPLPMQSVLIFWSVALLLLGISYVIRRGDIKLRKPVLFMVWLGNVFGFLFNGIYVLASLGKTYGYPLTFGGLGELVLHVSTRSHLNIIESMYGMVGGVLCLLLLGLLVAYGLSLKERFEKEGRTSVAWLGYVVVALGWFCFFALVLLLVGYYETVYTYLIYSITGSIFFIYMTNLFTKGSRFLEL